MNTVNSCIVLLFAILFAEALKKKKKRALSGGFILYETRDSLFIYVLSNRNKGYQMKNQRQIKKCGM